MANGILFAFTLPLDYNVSYKRCMEFTKKSPSSPQPDLFINQHTKSIDFLNCNQYSSKNISIFVLKLDNNTVLYRIFT